MDDGVKQILPGDTEGRNNEPCLEIREWRCLKAARKDL